VLHGRRPKPLRLTLKFHNLIIATFQLRNLSTAVTHSLLLIYRPIKDGSLSWACGCLPALGLEPRVSGPLVWEAVTVSRSHSATQTTMFEATHYWVKLWVLVSRAKFCVGPTLNTATVGGLHCTVRGIMTFGATPSLSWYVGGYELFRQFIGPIVLTLTPNHNLTHNPNTAESLHFVP
jgi:hypothetical protein